MEAGNSEGWAEVSTRQEQSPSLHVPFATPSPPSKARAGTHTERPLQAVDNKCTNTQIIHLALTCCGDHIFVTVTL